MKDFTLDDIKNLIELTLDAPPTGDSFIDNRLEKHIEKFGRVDPYYRFFYHLAIELQPDFVVELGSWQATAAAHFASGCPSATMITIDHHGDPGDEENMAMAVKAQRQYKNLHYLRGWTWDLKEKVADYGKETDILFIDSWHMYDKFKKDWDDYSPMLADGALVICDDIVGGYGPTIAGMLDFWNELPEPKFLNDKVHVGYPMGFLKYENST